MPENIFRRASFLLAVFWIILFRANQSQCSPVSDIRNATVFTVNEYANEKHGVELASSVKSHVWVRAWFKWANEFEYNGWAVEEAHRNGALFGGGVTVSSIYRGENGISDERFYDLVTYDPARKLYFALGMEETNYHHGSLENKAYLDYVLSFAFKQIDAGIDTIFMDEVHGAYSAHEGYDDYGIEGFARYLLEKYAVGRGWKADDKRWGTVFNVPLEDGAICPDGTMKTFEYREYLRRFGFLETPQSPENPLAAEWGFVTGYTPRDPGGSYSSDRSERAWRYLTKRLREYAASKGRKIYITANGNNKYVDYQTNNLWIDWTLKDGRMDAGVPLIMKWKTLVEDGKALAGNVPVVFFHDWGPMGIPFKTLSAEDKINWMRIYGAEMYAAGGIFAFPVSGPPGDAGENGTLDEIIRQASFYHESGDVYRNQGEIRVFGTGVRTSGPGISVSLAELNDPPGKVVHLINHNYNHGSIVPQENFTVKAPLRGKPSDVKILSPDFKEPLHPEYSYENGALRVEIPLLEAYDVVVIYQ
ncbi:MAG: hypothetical protein AB1742_03200 [bacterium]